MKIKRIELENHPILKNLTLDFTNAVGEPLNTVLIAGENGAGKTNILNLIFEFSILDTGEGRKPAEKRKITIQLSPEEVSFLQTNGQVAEEFKDGVQNGEMIFEYNFSAANNTWARIEIKYKDLKGREKNSYAGLFGNNPEAHKVLRTIFSDVEINFNPARISSVTAKNIDDPSPLSTKSQPGLATEIAQLLVDVQALDDADTAKWVRMNIGSMVQAEHIATRMNRFTDAFNYMISNKSYAGINNENNGKQVLFDENGQQIAIEALSSGEKQIIFRGSFLLKDKGNNEGIVVLIDEPEISLHPRWQLKALGFYKKLFTNQEGEQTSQLIIATHSPFIIHNEERLNSKVIIIKKDANGRPFIPEHGEFYGWSPEKEIFEAFDISLGDPHKPTLITEGKTDCSLIRTAWHKINPGIDMPFNIVASGVELQEGDRNGSARHVQMTLNFASTINDGRTVIGLFDNDREGNRQFCGLDEKAFEKVKNDTDTRKHLTKNIFGLLLPVPGTRNNFVSQDRNHRHLVIEHLFSNEILEQRKMQGEPILAGTEVFEIKGNKTAFAEYAQTLEASDFANFKTIFDKIAELAA